MNIKHNYGGEIVDITSKKIIVSEIISDPFFKIGYNDYRLGKPLNHPTNNKFEQVRYEEGRWTAAEYKARFGDLPAWKFFKPKKLKKWMYDNMIVNQIKIV